MTLLVGIGALILGIAIGASGKNTSTADPGASPATETTTVTAQAAAPGAKTVTTASKPKAAPVAATLPGDGTYLVPSEMKPGTWKSVGPVDDRGNCYWARMKSADGSVSSILANDNASGAAVVTIKATDKAFKSSGCQDWRRIG